MKQLYVLTSANVFNLCEGVFCVYLYDQNTVVDIEFITQTCCSLLKIIGYRFSYETAKANYFNGDFYIDL